MAIVKNHKIAAFIIAALALVSLVSLPVSAGSSTAWSKMASGTTMDLSSVWGADNSDVFAVGSYGTILHFNGSAWSTMASGTAANLAGVWGASGSDVFAVGNSGTILHFNGSAWNAMTSGVAANLAGVWGASGSDVFAVGNSGTILRYDGSVWSAMTSGTSANLSAVWGVDNSHVFAVGSSGAILYYNGSAWSAMASGTTANLFGVWGASGSDVFAVGGPGTVLHYDGAAWTPLSSGVAGDLYGVWGTGGSDVFAVGSSGITAHYNGSGFSSMSRDTNSDLRSVRGFSSIDVFAVGKAGTILRYLPPLINSLLPIEGNQGETLDVTISGQNFNDASEVRFGDGIAINSFTVNSPTQITAGITIVAGAEAGNRDVSVTTPGGSYTLPDAFEVNQALPVITSVTPAQGRQGETLVVTLSGANLHEASEVRFGAGISVNSFAVLDSNRITANITIAADALTAIRDVTVITPGGSVTLPGSFTVNQALPSITSISPNQNRQGETQVITINGTNLNGATGVQLGAGITVNSFTVVGPGQITAEITVAVDAAAGARDVSVTTPGGSFTLPGSFTVKQALPTITAVNPAQGNQETTIDIIIVGTNLGGTSDIQLGAGIIVNSFAVINATQISASVTITSGAQSGSRDVSVTTPGGSYALPGSFRVKQALPTILAVTPNNGSQGATLNISITGTNFSGASEVRLGTGIAVNSFNILSPSQIIASITIVAGTETGSRSVSVTTPGGSSLLPNGFTVNQGLPVIVSVNPGQGSRGSSLNVIISGSNLDGATAVSFGAGTTVQSFTNLSPTQISVSLLIADDAVTGLRDVSVSTPGGSATLSNRFTVKDPSPGTLIIALIWTGVAVVVVIFIFTLNALRQRRSSRI
jgi:hypothetical protein